MWWLLDGLWPLMNKDEFAALVIGAMIWLALVALMDLDHETWW